MSNKLHPMLIGGRNVETKKSIDVVNPATGEVCGQVPEADAAAIQLALRAAQEGFKVWSTTTPANRKAAILKYAGLLDQHRDRIVKLLIAETGKPQDNAEYDFGMLTTCLRERPEREVCPKSAVNKRPCKPKIGPQRVIESPP